MAGISSGVYEETDKNDIGSSQEEVSTLTKKYGGIVPKKKPLISKDHERAFFDSADWALDKQGATQGQQSRSDVVSLRPKLQRTPHQRLPLRRPAYTSGDMKD
ncbi:hypothetical protein AMTRI_Chr02g263830 [Amborella trichopoda]|uniref:Negatively light-regulated protein n=1 Tax=Amborella trichopoda TaxID=13333 RepID=U5D5Q1_AMBTC|nr:uncharacterized protein LOC18445087 [Amborella trichopoda]XP_011627369.1 uncharacterized protein LOC18445087 [Amborella trichopoda]XP_011627370.1 uncharacterized protein LOC18445087 [Amborella trichopoda]XP_020529727.1 uncharacterized protein LOC18445087 [Amborella trichopoda]ERN16762.1 hypothetical protein AMTR_s00057p00050780 [Amborella trichopoda]|eukprot:XP_006855295.1 uncharacterized protein LOC18445087 [Amborella trichopoda]